MSCCSHVLWQDDNDVLSFGGTVVGKLILLCDIASSRLTGVTAVVTIGRVNVISRRTLQNAAQRHPQGRDWVEHWYRVARQATWVSLADVRANYASADLVGSCLVFNAPQGRRLIARVVFADQYQYGTLFIVGYLTHADYDLDHWKGRCC